MAPLPFGGLAPGESATLTDQRTASWAAQAGFTGADLPTAIAVSIAEDTSRRVDAVSGVNGDGSRDYGPWQINDKAHADLFTQYPQWWTVSNADMAHSVWSTGGGWKAWTTYKNGDYRKYLARALTAASNYTSTAPALRDSSPNADQTGDSSGVVNQNFLTTIGDSVATIAGDVYKASAWLADPHNWTRIALVMIGAIVVIGVAVKTTSKDMGITPSAIVKAVK